MRPKSRTPSAYLSHPDIPAIVKHSIDLSHSVQFQDTRILATETGHVECIIRKARKLLLQTLKKQRKAPPPGKSDFVLTILSQPFSEAPHTAPIETDPATALFRVNLHHPPLHTVPCPHNTLACCDFWLTLYRALSVSVPLPSSKDCWINPVF
jgi:hypothetical protein